MYLVGEGRGERAYTICIWWQKSSSLGKQTSKWHWCSWWGILTRCLLGLKIIEQEIPKPQGWKKGCGMWPLPPLSHIDSIDGCNSLPKCFLCSCILLVLSNSSSSAGMLFFVKWPSSWNYNVSWLNVMAQYHLIDFYFVQIRLQIPRCL